MAKTTSHVSVTQGAGVNLSTFDLASGRRRQTVIIGDADSAGEENLIELPATGQPDRGAAIKIGGHAARAPHGPYDEEDRVDAWFTLEGQLGVIATLEPGAVYDDSRRMIEATSVALPLAVSLGQIVAAAPSLKTKVLAVSLVCSAFTSAGIVYLGGGSVNFNLGYVSAVGSTISFGPSPLVFYETLVNTALNLGCTGTATLNVNVVYYQAP